MLRILLSLVAGCCFAGSLFCVYYSIPSKPRGLEAMAPDYDFGQLGQGEKVAATFEVVNHHDRPITIVDYLKSCDCASVSHDKAELGLGEKTTIRALWKIGSRRGQARTQIWVVYQVVGEEFPHRTALQLKATVKPDIEMSATRLVFQSNTAAKQVVSFTHGRMATFELRKAYVTQSAFDARLLPESNQVEVSFDPRQWPTDGTQAYLRVETDSPNEPIIEIELTATER